MALLVHGWDITIHLSSTYCSHSQFDFCTTPICTLHLRISETLTSEQPSIIVMHYAICIQHDHFIVSNSSWQSFQHWLPFEKYFNYCYTLMLWYLQQIVTWSYYFKCKVNWVTYVKSPILINFMWLMFNDGYTGVWDGVPHMLTSHLL